MTKVKRKKSSYGMDKLYKYNETFKSCLKPKMLMSPTRLSLQPHIIEHFLPRPLLIGIICPPHVEKKPIFYFGTFS